MNDGSEPLSNRKHERFALAVASGEVSQAEAYRRCVSDKGTDKSIWEAAARVSADDKVKSRIQFLRKEVQKRVAEFAAGEVLTIAEKRKFLADAIRTPISEVGRHSVLCQEWSETDGEKSSSRRLKMVDKLKAIQLDNDLAGDGSEAEANDAIRCTLSELIGGIRRRRNA